MWLPKATIFRYMKIMDWFRKDKKEEKKASTIDRIQVEDLIEQDFTCREIAEQVGCTENDVYAIKNAKKRREARMQGSRSGADQDPEDPITQMNTRIKELELKQKELELQWKIEDMEAERKDELMEFLGQTGEENQDPMSMMMMAFLQGMMNKKQDHNPGDPGWTTPQNSGVVQSGSPQLSDPELINLTDEEIQDILDQYPAQVKMVQPLPDKVILANLRMKFQGYTDDTYTRAMQLIKKMKVKA